MISVIRLCVGQMQANCYLAICRQSRSALVIDPGDDPEYVTDTIGRMHVKPQAIIATHGHFDHVMGVPYLRQTFSIPFLIHRNDEFLLTRVNESAERFLGIRPGIPPIPVDSYIPQPRFRMGNISFEVFEAPGHTPGSVCLYSPSDACMFVGDVVFSSGGIGRYDFAYSDYASLNNSVSTIMSYPPDTKLYPGHGDNTSVGSERAFHVDNSP